MGNPRIVRSVCKTSTAVWFCTLLAAVVPFSIVRADDDPAELLFARRIAPLLNEKCLSCHGQNEEKIAGGLDLRTRATAMKGGESGQPAIVMGQPQHSPIWLAVTGQDENWSAMPPKASEKLTAAQLAWLKEWITAGATWPSSDRVTELQRKYTDEWSAEDGVTVTTAGGLSAEWSQRRYKPEGLWAYQPVQKPQLVQQGTAAIDELLARKRPATMELAPPASSLTFLRRATFDLTGLPPTPEEMEAFEQDFARDADTAVTQLIERLLASPHYGERMAQHWLDVTRYADSSGFANDYERGNAWRYRDYVISAFNNDIPFDRFIREQIAGDEIDPNDPEKIIATGFLRMGPWELTGMEVEKIARQRFLDDVTNSVGETFLAHSLQCARCHDHKFDPIPTRDYYAIQAVFATTQLAERAVPFLPSENIARFEERRFLERKQVEYQATLAELDAVLLQNAERWFQDHGKDPNRWFAAVETARSKPKSDRRPFADVFTQTRNALLQARVPEDDFPPKLVGFTPEQFGRERVARKGLERLRWELDRYEPFALAVYSGRTRELKSVNAPLRMPENRFEAGEVEETCVLVGGDAFSPGEKVNPGVLSAIASVADPITTQIEGRRRAFAEWVASAHNPLTARCLVNRIWLWHFGEPLAGNPNNFGSTGKRPTHPELLDWLATTFIERGWSIKTLHRVIMQSAAYRRASGQRDVVEPKDERLAREAFYAVFRPRRLSAEELRDAMLAATGELNGTLGGIPNRPEINLEAALQPRQVMGTFAAAWVPNARPEQRHRRSIYSLKLRGLADPMRDVFNAPPPDFSCERRDTSTVTPQVFALFNSQTSADRALALASRVLKEIEPAQPLFEDSVIDRCFRLTLGRPVMASELSVCLRHWHDMQSAQQSIVIKPKAQPLSVRRNAVEENTGERFTFDEILHENTEFVPDLQPADCDVRTRALADLCLVLLNTSEFCYVD